MKSSNRTRSSRPGEPSLAIRAYEPADLDGCRQLWRDLTQWHREIYDDPTIEGDDYFDRHLADPRLLGLWVARHDARPIGLTGLLAEGADGEIEPLVVAPSWKYRGVGRALVEFVIGEAKNRGMRYLNVHPVARNIEAIAFFHSAGFTTLGHINLLLELKPGGVGTWKSGIRLHRRVFRY
jgi:GNAT superfamily N-acetyltransferase